MKQKHKRRIGSVKNELLIKSREAMLCSVQIFNNPNVVFKSESFIVLSNIARTYLLHSFYKKKGIDYRYYEKKTQRKKYDKTKRGSYKYWDLERCLNDSNCPIDSIPKSNLKFLNGLRHEIEHQSTTRIDDYLSARFQAQLWKQLDARNPAKNYGVQIIKQWYWYDIWILDVEKYCKEHKDVLT